VFVVRAAGGERWPEHRHEGAGAASHVGRPSWTPGACAGATQCRHRRAVGDGRDCPGGSPRCPHKGTGGLWGGALGALGALLVFPRWARRREACACRQEAVSPTLQVGGDGVIGGRQAGEGGSGGTEGLVVVGVRGIGQEPPDGGARDKADGTGTML